MVGTERLGDDGEMLALLMRKLRRRDHEDRCSAGLAGQGRLRRFVERLRRWVQRLRRFVERLRRCVQRPRRALLTGPHSFLSDWLPTDCGTTTCVVGQCQRYRGLRWGIREQVYPMAPHKWLLPLVTAAIAKRPPSVDLPGYVRLGEKPWRRKGKHTDDRVL